MGRLLCLCIGLGGVVLVFGSRFVPAVRWSGVAAVSTQPPLAPRLESIVLEPGAVIVCEGDSLTQGTDRIESLATLFRGHHADTPYPAILATLLGKAVTVVNRGKGGDTARDGLARWGSAPSGDLAIIMYGGNDARIRTGGIGATPLVDFRTVIGELVQRRQRGGATVLVMASPQVGTVAAEQAIAPYRIAAREAALEHGALFIDTRTFLQRLPVPLKLDGVHLRPVASRAIGDGLAALIQVRE